MQTLADTYNLGLCDVAGHEKSLIDVMLSLGVKAILRRDVVRLDRWFADNHGICSCLIDRCDKGMSYFVVNPQTVDTSRL